jgi:hypothetical protein
MCTKWPPASHEPRVPSSTGTKPPLPARPTPNFENSTRQSAYSSPPMSTVPYAMRASPSKSCGGKLGAPFDPTLMQGEVAAMWKSPPPAFWN